MKESKIFSKQNLDEKVHYVYRVTIDEKYYIGKRTGFLNDLHTGAYKTSSKLIHEKLQNGKTFSKIKILQVFYTSEEALKFEKRILTRVKARTNPKFLNQSNGSGDFTFKQHTEKAKDKMSKSQRKRYDENTEEGIKRRENMSKKQKEKAKKHLQNRIEVSILGDLMFNEAFIKENFLIIDNKNNPRFLWSVYSKLSGFSESHIVKEKRIGKLSFLYGIRSISITEELENAKIQEIKAIVKSRVP